MRYGLNDTKWVKKFKICVTNNLHTWTIFIRYRGKINLICSSLDGVMARVLGINLSSLTFLTVGLNPTACDLFTK